MVMRGQREKTQNGQMGNKRFEDEGRAVLQHWQRGAKLCSEDILVGGVRGGSHSVTNGDTAGGQLQE